MIGHIIRLIPENWNFGPNRTVRVYVDPSNCQYSNYHPGRNIVNTQLPVAKAEGLFWLLAKDLEVSVLHFSEVIIRLA